MILTIIIGAMALTITGLTIAVKLKSKKLKTATIEAQTEKHKKEVLKKSIDNILILESENKELATNTSEHKEILRNSRSKPGVEKELTILRDNIFAEYNQLR